MSGAAPLRLSYDEARARVLAKTPLLPAERVPLERALGRALREDAVAPHPLPPFRNAAMDGYAVRAADVAGAPVELPVVVVIPAGEATRAPLAPGTAARIMTGAMIPDGADAVVPFEEAERIGAGPAERTRLRRAARPGENVRDAGADVAAGAIALAAGRELSPHDLALLGALGIASPLVGAAPRAAVLSTGDELLALDRPLVPGAIRDTNRPMLGMLLEGAGARVVLSEQVPDDPARVGERLRAALGRADVVLTIGGVSAGDFDPVKVALEPLGGIERWRVAMRPGRPQAFGAPGGRLVFGLPGNPASVACVFEALVRPALRRMQGFAELDRPRVPVRVAAAVPSEAGRTDFVRATLEWRDGVLWAAPAGAQVSGHLSPQAQAHALLVVPAERDRLEAGETAEALVLRLPRG